MSESSTQTATFARRKCPAMWSGTLLVGVTVEEWRTALDAAKHCELCGSRDIQVTPVKT